MITSSVHGAPGRRRSKPATTGEFECAGCAIRVEIAPEPVSEPDRPRSLRDAGAVPVVTSRSG